MDKVGYASYESFLADFVQRRNDLAHSYGDDDIVDPSLLGAYVDVIDSLLNSISRVANATVIRRLAELKLQYVGTVVKIWTGCIGVHMEGGRLAVGDRILLLKESWCTSHKVDSLQSDSIDMREIVFKDDVMKVGVKIGEVPHGCDSAKVYMLPDEWKEFWPSSQKWVAAVD
ncbi:hypothetical protein A5792_01355 [Mycolicibacterium peregrinum]|uniref:RiboL-PSP-HEPN domain-containing protein n=2 Tax=Mycolicibacterium peregrinum TaxID=43304 RepID=A0A1A0RD18_MYCPR|nr:hypothetical protein A5792_01355 [Mycolicibacterium peregrinum]